MPKSLTVITSLLLLLSPLAHAAPPEKLTYDKIAEEPHLWPDKVAVKKAFKFVEGAVGQGEAVTLISASASSLMLCKSRSEISFNTPPETTDLLVRAAALRQRLTPEQKALDFKALHDRPDLWPTEVTLHGGTTWPNGTKLADGAVITLAKMDESQIYVFYMGNKKINHIDPQRTDLFARARDLMALAPAKRVNRMVRLLQGKLTPPATPIEGVKPADPAPGTKYYVVVFAASDHADTPKLMDEVEKFYAASKPRHPEMEMILFALDKAMSERKSPGRAIAPAQLASLTWMRDLYDETLQPALVIFDANGVAVPDANVSESSTPHARLENLATLLETK